MAYSDPLSLLPLRGSAVIDGENVKEQSFIVAGIYSGGPQRESDGDEIIRYTFIDGTAKHGEDYGTPGGATSGELKIKWGGANSAIFVPLIVDTLSESDETFFIRFDRINKPGESQTAKIVITDRPLWEPAPLPLELEEPAPAWWPPGFPEFADTQEESPGPEEEGTTNIAKERRRIEDQANAGNETTDISNITSSDIVSQNININGTVVEKFFFDMSSFATPVVDQLGGSKLPDLIRLLDGDDQFTGGRGDDLIHGNGGDDWINGNQGDDQVEAGRGNDIVYGGKNKDIVNLGAGDDWANGNKGDDHIQGGAGNDTIFGGKNNDLIDLGIGDDWGNGNKGDDLIYGGIGDDYLNGGMGDDSLWGGEGADSFAMSKGADIAKDFRPSEGDRVLITSDTAFTLTEQNGAALLLTDHGSLLFEGIAKGAFDSNLFVNYT